MHDLLALSAILIWAMNSIVSKLSAGLIEPAAISFFIDIGIGNGIQAGELQ